MFFFEALCTKATSWKFWVTLEGSWLPTCCAFEALANETVRKPLARPWCKRSFPKEKCYAEKNTSPGVFCHRDKWFPRHLWSLDFVQPGLKIPHFYYALGNLQTFPNSSVPGAGNIAIGGIVRILHRFPANRQLSSVKWGVCTESKTDCSEKRCCFFSEQSHRARFQVTRPTSG